ncbi:MAG: hypothetical protein K8S25_17700 [Alphaproteobacteria bacterium]|nr:hypothetical protein [Alphaproteobacteria bacterium]
MALEILDGTIDATAPVSARGGFAIFNTLRFRDRSGVERSFKTVCTGGEVTDLVRKGGTGRFYLSSGGGQTGIHGVRLDNGTQAYAHYNNMEIIVLIGIAAGLGTAVIGVTSGEWIWALPSLIGVLLAGAYYFLRSVRLAGKQQYENDKK